MRRSIIVAALATGSAALLASPAFAATPTSSPYTYTSQDSGTCHPYDGSFTEVPWAFDLGTRTFTTPNPVSPGTYAIVENFTQGHFSAKADPGPNGPGSLPAAGAKVNYSPGACDGTGAGGGPDNGHRIREGVPGTFSGNEHLTITNGSYTAGDGSCAGEDSNGAPVACTTSSYVAYHYGSGATATLTSYRFDYISHAKGVKGTYVKGQTGGHYTDIGTSSDGGTTFTYQEKGDVYTSTITPVNTTHARVHARRA